MEFLLTILRPQDRYKLFRLRLIKWLGRAAMCMAAMVLLALVHRFVPGTLQSLSMLAFGLAVVCFGGCILKALSSMPGWYTLRPHSEFDRVPKNIKHSIRFA